MLLVAVALAAMSPAADDQASTITGSEFVWRGSRRFHLLTTPQRRAALALPPRYGTWEQLRVLGNGKFGTWSLRGVVAGLGASCTGETRSRCSPIAEGGLALSWQPRGSFITFFGGVVFTSPTVGSMVGASARQKAAPMVVGGIVVALPSMLEVVKLARGIPVTWGF